MFWVGVSQLHVIMFAVKGFVTHWLQALSPCLASHQSALHSLSQAAKRRSCESCLYCHCEHKKQSFKPNQYEHEHTLDFNCVFTGRFFQKVVLHAQFILLDDLHQI